jgi:hypothetical protein
MKKATATCAKMGKEVQVVNQQNDAQFTGASVNITFKCVDPAPTPPGSVPIPVLNPVEELPEPLTLECPKCRQALSSARLP